MPDSITYTPDTPEASHIDKDNAQLQGNYSDVVIYSFAACTQKV